MGTTYTVVIDEGGMARTYTRVGSRGAPGSSPDFVQWIVLGGGSRQIRFKNGPGPFDNGSPLLPDDLVFAVRGNEKRRINPDKYPPGGGGPIHYKYDILSIAGALMDDPDIVLEE